MDPLSDVLAGPRARAAFTLRAVLEPPWGIDVHDRSPLTLVAVLRGEARFISEVDDTSAAREAQPASLAAGDVLLIQGQRPYRIADRDGSASGVTILPGQQCVDRAGRPVAESMGHGLRTWGNDPAGRDVLVIGAYESIGEVSQMLTAALPRWLIVRSEASGEGSGVSAALAMLAAEMRRDGPGQGSVLDRLLDVLLIQTVRAHAEIAAGLHPSWLVARDPIVLDALRLLHADVTRAWTLEGLARRVGTSRATLSRKFVAEVGLPPMGYLIRWRLARAADLLVNPEVTVATTAAHVGYGTPFALSAAFKRQYGMSPRDYRTQAG